MSLCFFICDCVWTKNNHNLIQLNTVCNKIPRIIMFVTGTSVDPSLLDGTKMIALSPRRHWIGSSFTVLTSIIAGWGDWANPEQQSTTNSNNNHRNHNHDHYHNHNHNHNNNNNNNNNQMWNHLSICFVILLIGSSQWRCGPKTMVGIIPLNAIMADKFW